MTEREVDCGVLGWGNCIGWEGGNPNKITMRWLDSRLRGKDGLWWEQFQLTVGCPKSVQPLTASMFSVRGSL